MNIEIKENTLYLVDIDLEEIDDLLRQKQTMLEKVFVLRSDLLLPFDDLMRTIIIVIYQHNIKEIVVISNPNKNGKRSLWRSEDELQEGIQEKIQTLDYFFKNCKPEFFGKDLNEWLGNRKTIGSQNTVSVISLHPLIPSDIKITEIDCFVKDESMSING